MNSIQSDPRQITTGVKGSVCFRVRTPATGKEDTIPQIHRPPFGSDDGEFMANEVFGKLAALEATISQQELVADSEIAETQVSPWLEITRWLH